MEPVIGIVGARVRNTEDDFNIVRDKLLAITESIPSSFMIVSGGCAKGADRFAELLTGGKIRIHFPVVRPNMTRWEYRKACYDRNTLIAEDSDQMIACVAPDRKGGTEDTIKKFCKKSKMTEWEAVEKGILHLV